MDCELVKREVEVTLEFEGCLDHQEFRPTGGRILSHGVPTGLYVDGVLGVMEEAISHEVAEHPKVQRLLSHRIEGLDGDSYGLEDRTKRLLLKLLAHQLMLGRVANREYQTGSVSMATSLPLGDG